MRFRLVAKAGTHDVVDKAGLVTTYKAGDIIESDRDLRKQFEGKFELTSGDPDAEKVVSPPDIPLANKSIKSSTKVQAVDVSDQFPLAEKVGLKVLEKANWFTVIDPDNDDQVQNDKKLRKNQVDAFLAEYEEIPEEDDAEDD